jgi:hypothetical protein
VPQAKRTHQLKISETKDLGEDVELTRLGAEFREKHCRRLELTDRQQRSVGKPPRHGKKREILSLMQAKQELAEAIADLKATAISGLRVKASVLLA